MHLMVQKETPVLVAKKWIFLSLCGFPFEIKSQISETYHNILPLYGKPYSKLHLK